MSWCTEIFFRSDLFGDSCSCWEEQLSGRPARVLFHTGPRLGERSSSSVWHPQRPTFTKALDSIWVAEVPKFPCPDVGEELEDLRSLVLRRWILVGSLGRLDSLRSSGTPTPSRISRPCVQLASLVFVDFSLCLVVTWPGAWC